MAQVKVSAEDMKKLAEQEQFDREQAFELGFAKVAHDMGLNEDEFKQFYQAGVQALQPAQPSK
jgi:hypothetical protein